MRHNIRGLLSDPTTRKALLDRATQGVIAVGPDGTHPVKDNEHPMNKSDIFAALTAYLNTHGGPGALRRFVEEYEQSIAGPPAPIVDTLIVLGDGETWAFLDACSFVDVTEEEHTEILEGNKVKCVVDEQRWRPVYDTREVWVVCRPDRTPARVFHTEARAKEHVHGAEAETHFYRFPLSDD